MNSNTSTDKNYFGFFGKLPQFPDFIKFRSSSDEFNILDDWIQKGIISAKLSFGNNWKEIYSNSDSYEFVFPVSKYNKIVAGTLNPGYDKAGRQFPFVVFSVFEDSFFNSFQIGILPLILNSFYYRAKQLYLYSLKAQELNEIIDEFNKAEIRISSANAANEIFDEYLSMTTVNELYSRIKFSNSLNDSEPSLDYKFYYQTDDENSNFDTGFILEMISSKIKSDAKQLCFFKYTDSNYNVRLFFYDNIPEPTEFPRLVLGKFTSYPINLVLGQPVPDISLKELLIAQQS